MKLAALVSSSSSLRPAAAAAAAMLLLLVLIGRAEPAALPLDQPLSPPLQSEATYRAVQEVSQHAQSLLPHDDTAVRVYPRDHLRICCLHATFLDYYLMSILPRFNEDVPSLSRLRSDLGRISSDLRTEGCKKSHSDHQHTVEFHNKLRAMGEPGIIKAVGEVDILFMYLQDICTAPAVAPTAAADTPTM